MSWRQFSPCICEDPLMNYLSLLFFKSVHGYSLHSSQAVQTTEPEIRIMQFPRRLSISIFQLVQYRAFDIDQLLKLSLWRILSWTGIRWVSLQSFPVSNVLVEKPEDVVFSCENRGLIQLNTKTSVHENAFLWTDCNCASKQWRRRDPIILPD